MGPVQFTTVSFLGVYETCFALKHSEIALLFVCVLCCDFMDTDAFPRFYVSFHLWFPVFQFPISFFLFPFISFSSV